MIEGPYDFTAWHIEATERDHRHFVHAGEAHIAWEKHRAGLGIPGRTDRATYIAGYMQAIRDMETNDA